MTTNGFDEIGMQHRQRGVPLKVTAHPAQLAALDRQRHTLAALEESPTYAEMCAAADAKRVALNNAPKYSSGRLVK